jgi:hypothetical protein
LIFRIEQVKNAGRVNIPAFFSAIFVEKKRDWSKVHLVFFAGERKNASN